MKLKMPLQTKGLSDPEPTPIKYADMRKPLANVLQNINLSNFLEFQIVEIDKKEKIPFETFEVRQETLPEALGEALMDPTLAEKLFYYIYNNFYNPDLQLSLDPGKQSYFDFFQRPVDAYTKKKFKTLTTYVLYGNVNEERKQAWLDFGDHLLLTMNKDEPNYIHKMIEYWEELAPAKTAPEALETAYGTFGPKEIRRKVRALRDSHPQFVTDWQISTGEDLDTPAGKYKLVDAWYKDKAEAERDKLNKEQLQQIEKEAARPRSY
jgi:hypothetical protein